MNGLKITAKKLQVYVKEGYTPEDVMDKHEITEEELLARLKHIYKAGDGSKAVAVYNDLVANRKKPHHIKRSSVKVSAAAAEETIRDRLENTNESNTMVQPETSAAKEVSEEKEKSLDELKKEEESLSKEVMQLESDHKELSGKHRACAKELRNLEKVIDELEAKIEECDRQINEIAEKADSIAVLMNEKCVQRKQKLAELNRLREEIEERGTVTICVTSDGVIEAPENPEFVIDDAGYQSVKDTIRDREEVEDLRVREVTTLAKLLKIAEKASRVNLICDSQELEIAFQALRSSQ